MKRFGALFALVVLLSVPVVAAAQSGYPSGGGSSGGGIQMGGGGGSSMGSGDVTIVDFAFQPAAIFVTPGETVTWYNSGAADHTVDANSGAFDSPTLTPGASFSQTFTSGGVFPYHCDFHPNMRGMVVVTGM